MAFRPWNPTGFRGAKAPAYKGHSCSMAFRPWNVTWNVPWNPTGFRGAKAPAYKRNSFDSCGGETPAYKRYSNVAWPSGHGMCHAIPQDSCGVKTPVYRGKCKSCTITWDQRGFMSWNSSIVTLPSNVFLIFSSTVSVALT